MQLIDSFKCRQLTNKSNNGHPSLLQPPPSTGYPQVQYSLSPAQANVTALTNLAKLYNENDKFSGDKYDVLSHKLVIFQELCAKVGILPDQTDRYKLAISTMLTGKASAYYY
jgi:hypothetical protein